MQLSLRCIVINNLHYGKVKNLAAL